MSLLYPEKKDQYLQPIRSVMELWLNERSNITFSPKVRRHDLADLRAKLFKGRTRWPSASARCRAGAGEPGAAVVGGSSHPWQGAPAGPA
jgi:hypothetical protein